MATQTQSDRRRKGRGPVSSSEVVVVMVPLPAQGHLNQLLHLSRLIAAYNITVHYATTATHISQARRRVHGWDPLAVANVHFDDLPFPEFQSPSPNPNAANNFPSHLQPLFNTLPHLRKPLTALIHSLSSTADRVVVIHDSMMSSVVQDVASVPNAESFVFHSISAFSIFWYFWESLQCPFPIDEGLQEVPSLEDCFTQEFMELIISEQNYLDCASGNLFNTCREIESDFLDLIEKMSEDQNQRNFAIGPFNPLLAENENLDLSSKHECLQWLNKQERDSVIFISFGTTTSLPNEQIRELAAGIEDSGVKFIWVVREADKADCTADGGVIRNDPLPEGFEERVRERGVVVRDWAPQMAILGHSATGGFLTHCGWNSCMESISMGVPAAAWPMHSDQPRNAVLMTEVLKIGVVVKDWGKRKETLVASEISRSLKRLMESEEGTEVRRRAEELGGVVRRAVAEGGVTRLEMDSFIAHISR